MPDNLLSQEEIDALFAKRKKERAKKQRKSGAPASETAVESDRGGGGGALPQGVVFYDFKNPNRLSREEVQRLRLVHQSFLRSANMSFSLLLETPVDGGLTAVDQLTYREFIQALSPITCIGTGQIEGHDGEFMIELSHTLLFPLLNRMLGGTGTAYDPKRELTEIEISIARHIFDRYLDILARAWSPSEEEDSLAAKLVSIETSPRFVSAASEGQSVLVVVLQVRVGTEEGSLSICYPHTMLEPLLAQLELSQQSGVHRHRQTEIGQSLSAVPIELHAELGNVEIDLSSLVDLKEGDIIRLDKDVNVPIRIFSGDVHVADARPGAKGERNAFQVLRSVGPEVGTT